MVLVSGGINFSVPLLVAFGAKSNPDIIRGEWWRLETATFVHGGLLHILLDGYALFILGQLLEGIYGHRKFFIIYTISGLLASFSSFRFSNAVSVGASGAIFGLAGAGIVMGIRHRSQLPSWFARQVGIGLIPFAVLNLLLGFSIAGIDNFAHLGGLTGGVIAGLVIPPNAFSPPRTTLSRLLTNISFFLSALIAIFSIGVAAHNLLVTDHGLLNEAPVELGNPNFTVVLPISNRWEPINPFDGGSLYRIAPHTILWVQLLEPASGGNLTQSDLGVLEQALLNSLVKETPGAVNLSVQTSLPGHIGKMSTLRFIGSYEVFNQPYTAVCDGVWVNGNLFVVTFAGPSDQMQSLQPIIQRFDRGIAFSP